MKCWKRNRGNIGALILFDEHYIHCFPVFCYINQIEKSGFVFSNPICVQDFALRSWFSCSFLLSFSPDYWLQRLEQETCFGSPDIRAAKPAEGIYVTYSLIGKKKKKQSKLIIIFLKLSHLLNISLLGELFPRYSFLSPISEQHMSLSHQGLTSISLWFFKCSLCSHSVSSTVLGALSSQGRQFVHWGVSSSFEESFTAISFLFYNTRICENMPHFFATK